MSNKHRITKVYSAKDDAGKRCVKIQIDDERRFIIDPKLYAYVLPRVGDTYWDQGLHQQVDK